MAAELNADNVRPLTDTVNTLAVAEVDYQIAGTVTLYADADPASTMTAVNTAAQDYAMALAARIQRDIVPSQIIEALSVPGVYQVVLTEPGLFTIRTGAVGELHRNHLEPSDSSTQQLAPTTASG